MFSVSYGMVSTCPTEIMLMFVILLALAIFATVDPKRTAIDESVSPDLTVYDRGVGAPPPPPPELVPLSAGIATGVGIDN